MPRRFDVGDEYYRYITRFCNLWAPIYDAVNVFASRVRDRVVDIAAPVMGSRVLDVATGTGKQAFAFARSGCDVVGIDISKGMLKVANRKNKYANARFHLGDAADLPFDDDNFDVSTISFALHDMPSDIRQEVLSEMVRVTGSRGKIMIIDYGLPGNRFLRALDYHFTRIYESKYYPDFIKSDIHEMFGNSGIEVLEEISVMGGGGRIYECRKMSADA